LNAKLADSQANDQPSLSALEHRLGHHFAQPQLLVQALTHASAQDARATTANERLEFLGDRVLGLLAAEALIQRFPDSPEGNLAPRLNALVRKERCAAVATELDLARHLRVSEGEARAGRSVKTGILADACEAVMAAIYLDGGIEAARRFFVLGWRSALDEVEVMPRDAKSALQEWTQDRALGLPSYALIGREGPDHQPRFLVRASVAGQGEADGRGPSKRTAEQAAAAAFLVQLGVWSQADADRALAASVT